VFVEILLLWLGLSVVAGIVAASKGRSGFGYFLLSLVLSPLIGLLLAALLPRVGAAQAQPAEPTRKCPECAETVLLAAKKCKHCGAELPPVDVAAQAAAPVDRGGASNILIAITAMAFIVLLAKSCGG
jgi:hypothetical protein